jgi:hypothetical protein
MPDGAVVSPRCCQNPGASLGLDAAPPQESLMQAIEPVAVAALAVSVHVTACVTRLSLDVGSVADKVSRLLQAQEQGPAWVGELVRACEMLEGILDLGRLALAQVVQAQAELAAALSLDLKRPRNPEALERVLGNSQAAMRALSQSANSLRFTEHQAHACLAWMTDAVRRSGGSADLYQVRSLLQRIAGRRSS